MHSGSGTRGMGGDVGGPPDRWGHWCTVLMASFTTSPGAPQKCLWGRVARPPTLPQPAWERQLPALPGRTPPPSGAHPPTAAVGYLTTDTDIQREPPCDPHPESRHPRPGARCSTAGGGRAAERPGRAEVR